MKLSEKIAYLQYKPEDGKSSQRLYDEFVRKIEPDIINIVSHLSALFQIRQELLSPQDEAEIKQIIKDNL